MDKRNSWATVHGVTESDRTEKEQAHAVTINSRKDKQNWGE